MYAISTNKRKYSPTPVVRLYLGSDGKTKEQILFISTLSKEEGDKLSERIVKLLNDNTHTERGMYSVFTQPK